MSKLLIQQYYTKLDKVLQYGGSRNETSIRRPFENLLNDYAQKKNLELVPELYEGTKIRSKEEALFESSIFVDAHLGNTGVEGDL